MKIGPFEVTVLRHKSLSKVLRSDLVPGPHCWRGESSPAAAHINVDNIPTHHKKDLVGKLNLFRTVHLRAVAKI